MIARRAVRDEWEHVFVYRYCNRCDQHLPEEAFNRHRGGRQWWCRECFRSYFRARGDLHLRQVKASKRRRRLALRLILLHHLATHPCTDCGETDLRVLELDHVLPRSSYVAELLSDCARPDAVRDEIKRCEVVCANCHRRRTAKRGGWKRLRPDQEEPLHRKPFIDRNLRWVYEQLSRASCVDCGLEDPLVLEHDHVGDKRDSVMALVHNGYSRANIEKEIAQCEVRCVNCHRRRHVESGAWFRSRALISDPPP